MISTIFLCAVFHPVRDKTRCSSHHGPEKNACGKMNKKIQSAESGQAGIDKQQHTGIFLMPRSASGFPVYHPLVKLKVYALFFTILTIDTGVPRFHCFLHPSNSKPYL